jgi:predicted flap endonuclease-1-like 5' DNA nuclease
VNIEEVEGIGPVHATSLRGIGITTTDALLERGASAGGRAELAEAAGVSPKLVLEWVNHVDLMRIDGVGSEYSDLLEAAGVDSPAELAQRNAANLAQTFQELDAARPDWIRSIPSEATVENWIAQARALPKIVTHGGGDGSGGTDDGGERGESAAGVAETAEAMEAAPVAAEREASAEAEPMAAAEPAVARASSAELDAPRDDGLWGRIKRLFGG